VATVRLTHTLTDGHVRLTVPHRTPHSGHSTTNTHTDRRTCPTHRLFTGHHSLLLENRLSICSAWGITVCETLSSQETASDELPSSLLYFNFSGNMRTIQKTMKTKMLSATFMLLFGATRMRAHSNSEFTSITDVFKLRFF